MEGIPLPEGSGMMFPPQEVTFGAMPYPASTVRKQQLDVLGYSALAAKPSSNKA